MKNVYPKIWKQVEGTLSKGNTYTVLAIVFRVKAYTPNVFDLLVSTLLENHIKIFTEMSQTCIKIAF